MEQHFLTRLFTPAWMATCSTAPPPGSVSPTAPGREHSPTVPVSQRASCVSGLMGLGPQSIQHGEAGLGALCRDLAGLSAAVRFMTSLLRNAGNRQRNREQQPAKASCAVLMRFCARVPHEATQKWCVVPQNHNSLFTNEWTAVRLAQGPLYRIAALVIPRGESEKVGQHKSVTCTLWWGVWGGGWGGGWQLFKEQTPQLLDYLHDCNYAGHQLILFLLVVVDFCWLIAVFSREAAALCPAYHWLSWDGVTFTLITPAVATPAMFAPQPSVWDVSGAGSAVTASAWVPPVTRSDNGSSPVPVPFFFFTTSC